VDALTAKIGEAAACVVCGAAEFARGVPAALWGSDALVFVFPLYVDGIPSHLLRFLDESMRDIAEAASGATVYVAVNNGFFEGRQNAVALEIMRNFTARAGLRWGLGLGVGAGGMIRAARMGYGPMKNLGKALDALASDILASRTGEDRVCEPNFPKALYNALAHLGWRASARKNGVKRKKLYLKS
jgi:multimeric flavodoxin WrbA